MSRIVKDLFSLSSEPRVVVGSEERENKSFTMRDIVPSDPQIAESICAKASKGGDNDYHVVLFRWTLPFGETGSRLRGMSGEAVGDNGHDGGSCRPERRRTVGGLGRHQ